MVEIDYYSKYLKYKQKYLKQKNLQIGGTFIKVTIILNYTKNTFNSKEYLNQLFDSTKNIYQEIHKWLKSENAVYENLSIKRKIYLYNSEEELSVDINKNDTFDKLGFSVDKDTLILNIN